MDFSPTQVAIIGFVVLFALMLLRVPVGMAMGLVGVCGFGYLSGSGPALKLIGQTSMRTVTDYNFGVIPMFMLMGSLVTVSGMSRELFRAANAAPAAYAVIAAQAAGGGDLAGLVAALSRAMWAEGRDISDDDTLRPLLVAHGFDANVADRGMLMAAETYAANLEEAVSRGVFGVPFFVVDDQKFWGQDRLDDLDLYLAGKL